MFLNCVLNHKILKRTKFKNLHIIPTCGDDGQSIGAAFYMYNNIFGLKNNKNKISPFLGISYSDDRITEIFSKYNLSYKKLDDKQLINEIITLVGQNFVLGLLRGRSEIGPRALGHRSILANPKDEYIKEHLNRYVKHRETFRPFAPIVTDDEQFEYFDLKADSPYMLFTANVKKKI